MKSAWIAVLGLAAAAAFTTPAAAFVCPAPGPFTPNAAQAADIGATGFSCKQVDLIINVNIAPITLQTLQIEAKTITIDTAQIINNTANSSVFLTAEGGGIAITKGEVRAENQLIIECKAANCPITIKDSIIKSPINPLNTNSGDTRAIANGNIIIENSTFYGGHKVGVFSQAGTVTWLCTPGVGGCEDPLKSGTALALCGPDPVDPTKPKLPCAITFTTLAEITGFCIKPGGDVDCGGGESECQINALLDVHLENSNIKCLSHFGVTSKAGSIFMNDAVLSARDALTFQAFKGIFAERADLSSTTGAVTLDVKGGIAPPGLCIDVKDADITKPRTFSAKNGCTVDTTGLTPP